MKIAFVQTGGTLDKDYPQVTKGWAFEITTPAFDRILEDLNPNFEWESYCLLYTSPSPRDATLSRMPSSA